MEEEFNNIFHGPSKEIEKVMGKRKSTILDGDKNMKRNKNGSNVIQEHNYFNPEEKVITKLNLLPRLQRFSQDVLNNSCSSLISMNNHEKDKYSDSLPDWLNVSGNSSDEDVHVTAYDNVIEQSPLSQLLNLLKKEQEKYEVMKEQKTKNKFLMTENISYYYLPIINVKSPAISKKQSTLNHFYKTLPRKDIDNYKEKILNEAKKVFCFKNNIDNQKNGHGNSRHIDFRTPQQALPITFVSPKINKTLPTAIRSKPFVQIKAKQFPYNPNVISIEKNNVSDEKPILNSSYFYINNMICDNVINESDETLNISIDTSNIQTRGCPPFKWLHLIYLAIKNSPIEYVSIHDVQIFISRWFPFYSNKSKEKIELALLTYTPHYFNSTDSNLKMNGFDDFPYKWTVNISSINVLEFQTRSIAKHYSNKNKGTINFPNKLKSVLKGYDLMHLGYDPEHLAIPNLKTDHRTKNI